jgi:acyl-CoA reductase-like NAD-dependent aldehyde dehydrogenase
MTTLKPGQLFLDGKWRDASDGGCYDVYDPATAQVIATVARATEADVHDAVTAARDAFDAGVWSGLSGRARGRILLKAAALLTERFDEFAQLESLDVGKPIQFTTTVDVPTIIDNLEYYGGLANSIHGETRTTGVPSFAYTIKQPLGVVAAVTPFNFPLILSLSKIAPALAAGNTVVHKPAEETSLTALKIAELLTDAGVPAGVFNVVTGGGEVGAALVDDARVDKIAFTGSTPIGKYIAATAASKLTKNTMELGGKSAQIIFADADLANAIDSAIGGFVFNTGQFCMAGSRLLVQRGVFDAVVDALTGAISHIPVGSPADPTTVIGPMTGPKHLAKVAGYVAKAKAAGADLRLGTQELPAEGWYARPGILVHPGQDSEFVQEEIFGPILTIQPFDTEQEAIALANGTGFGLAAGLHTSDPARAHRVAAALRAGIVWVNSWAILDVAMPFGGVGDSGYGREYGPEGLAEYLDTKSVIIKA